MDLVIKSLLERFRQDRDLTTLGEAEAFEAFAGFCVLSSFYEDEFNPDAFRIGGGNDLGIDVFGIVINGELLHDAADVREAVDQSKKLDVQVILVQAKTSSRFETKVISDLAENLGHVLRPQKMRYATSTDVDNIRACLDIVYSDVAKLSSGLPRLHVRYVTTGTQIADMVQQKCDSAEKQLNGIARFDSVSFCCISRNDLREMYQRATEAVSATFDMPKKIALPKIPGVEQSLHGLLAADELVEKLLTDTGGSIRKALFYENVRDFQDYNDVNSKIRETLRDPTRRQRFAVLNNGITIVTRGLTVVGDEIGIHDFQIVNGCQTCHVLFDERAELNKEVQVSVRIVHSQDEDVINGIVAATNRQTAVDEDDLSSREQFHKELEEYFTAQQKPRDLYYERRSKQYSSHQDVEKTRIISRRQLTRAYSAMFLNEPSGVGGYKKLVTTRGKDLFADGQYLIAYYTAAATLYRIEWLLRNRRIQSIYGPVRYHLQEAVKIRLFGPKSMPQKLKDAERECNIVLDVVWDPVASEKLVLDLLTPLGKAMDAEKAMGTQPGEMVRTQRFADRVRKEVLDAVRP